MKDLFVAATSAELMPLIRKHGISVESGHPEPCGNVDILITGMGVVAASVHLTRALASGNYKMIWNFGIAGSFSSEIGLGSSVHVTSQALADLGSESQDGSFRDLFEIGFLKANEPPFTDGLLQCGATAADSLLSELPRARGITVSRVLAEEKSIAWARQKYRADIVNMEGAAVFYSCLVHGVEFAEVRAISDYVGECDRTKWDIRGAIKGLNEVVERIYEQRNKLP